jgi:O-antigen/teichoic acid export membrane protein
MSVSSRSRRIFEGWSANLFLLLLGITQQVALIPIFLHFWSGETLAAWLVLYAAANLVLVADAGLQIRAINRFFSFKASVDCDGRTAGYYGAMLRVYISLTGLLIATVLAGTYFFRPSRLLGFEAISHFDGLFAVMTVGALLTLPASLTAGLYRARNLYGALGWLQCGAMLAAQLGEVIAIVTTGSLLAVAIAYVALQVLVQSYLVFIDAYRRFPFLRRARARWQSWRWTAGQFRRAFPYALANSTELALQNLPVLLVSAFVFDRLVVAQWGLTRVVAGLLRALCVQATLPLAAELGHDYAVGAGERLPRLYARGSIFVTLLAGVIASGLLSFWPDFFALWTHDAISYDPALTMTLLIGTALAAPSILAVGFANYSNRGELLARAKGLQLAVFLALSVMLTWQIGPLGAAIAIVASEMLVQFGLLAVVVIRDTLQRPVRHIAFLGVLIVVVMLCGWALGLIVRAIAPGTGLIRFLVECALWLGCIALVASPLANSNLRKRLLDATPV